MKLDSKPKTRNKIEDIPEFDLGEPELETQHAHTPDSEKRVVVEPDAEAEAGHHGEELLHMTPEEREKHKKFEALWYEPYMIAKCIGKNSFEIAKLNGWKLSISING